MKRRKHYSLEEKQKMLWATLETRDFDKLAEKLDIMLFDQIQSLADVLLVIAKGKHD